MREKYWAYYTGTKYELLYFYEYRSDSYRWQKYMESFLAIVSSTSVAAWAVWSQLPLLWAVLIAASQVMTAVKQYMPYSKRVSALSELLPRLDAVLNRIDHDWFRVDKGMLTEEQINDLLFRYKKECTDLANQHLAGVYFPEREDLRRAAQGKAECFFECF